MSYKIFKCFKLIERSALHRKLKLLNLHIPSNKFNDEDFYDNYE